MTVSELHVIGLEFVGRHGVEKWEREQGRRFRVDVKVRVENVRAFHTDQFSDTLNYEDLARVIMAVGQGPCHLLVERLAEQIADGCLELRFVTSVEVVVYKKAPGVLGSPDWVGVRIVRDKSSE